MRSLLSALAEVPEGEPADGLPPPLQHIECRFLLRVAGSVDADEVLALQEGVV